MENSSFRFRQEARTIHDQTRIRAGPRGSEDGAWGRGGGTECRRHESNGISRGKGENNREGFSPLTRGVRGPPPVKFFKIGLLRVHFQAIFKPISVILQVNFNFISAISNVTITRFLQKQHGGVNNIEDILATFKVTHSNA